MPYLKYYRDEQLRQPVAYAALCTPEEVRVAVRKLARHFGLRDISVKFTSGRRVSYACGARQITFNQNGMNWLLVAHEFAHCWHTARAWKKYEAEVAEWDLIPFHERGPRPGFDRGRGHCKAHARLTDRTVTYMEKKGWIGGAIKARIEVQTCARMERTQAAAQPPSPDQRIAHKEGLIANLEKKARRLQTLISKHRRSIAAIRRHQAKEN